MTGDDMTYGDNPGGPETEPALANDGMDRPRRRLGRAGLVAIVGAALALTAGGVALAAADPSPSTSPDTSTEVPLGPEGGAFGIGGPPGAGPFLGGPGLDLAGPPVHGEFTVPKRGGGYETVHMQRGDVTSVGSSSITVKSEDGFIDTYAVDSKTLVDARRDGIDSVKTGHSVVVTGVDVAGTLTARHILDATLVKAYVEKMAPGRPFLRDFRHMRMKLRSHIRQWLGDHHRDSSGAATYMG